MRLSEDRINSIAGAIAMQLVRRRMVITKQNLRQVAAWVEKPILEQLSREDDIDQTVTDYIKGLAKPPPEGSFDYQALFQKKKEEISRRRGFKI
jgi:hypothetical protein